jgi:hypothetical protein
MLMGHNVRRHDVAQRVNIRSLPGQPDEHFNGLSH